MLYCILAGVSSRRGPICSLHQSFTFDWVPRTEHEKAFSGVCSCTCRGVHWSICVLNVQVQDRLKTDVGTHLFQDLDVFTPALSITGTKNRRSIPPANLQKCIVSFSCKKIEKQFSSLRIPLLLLYYFIKTLLCSVLFYEVATHASFDRVQENVSPDVLHESHLLIYITLH